MKIKYGIIRFVKCGKEEYPQLKDFLYEAVYVPEGTAPPDRAIIDSPELQVYIRGFGNSGTIMPWPL